MNMVVKVWTSWTGRGLNSLFCEHPTLIIGGDYQLKGEVGGGRSGFREKVWTGMKWWGYNKKFLSKRDYHVKMVGHKDYLLWNVLLLL